MAKKIALNEERRFVPGYGWTPGPAPETPAVQARSPYWLIGFVPVIAATVFAFSRR